MRINNKLKLQKIVEIMKKYGANVDVSQIHKDCSFLGVRMQPMYLRQINTINHIPVRISFTVDGTPTVSTVASNYTLEQAKEYGKKLQYAIKIMEEIESKG